MRARRIIEGSAFGPEVIRVASEAFETAWSEIAGRFDPTSHDGVRETLATAIISATRADSTDAELLRRTGLEAMARAFPEQFASSFVNNPKEAGNE